MTLPGAPIKIDLTPGRRVLHVVTTEKGGVRTEHRYLYEIVGLARCHATGAYRVVCLGASGLRLFTLDIFERGFQSAEEPALSEPEKVAGAHHAGSGM